MSLLIYVLILALVLIVVAYVGRLIPDANLRNVFYVVVAVLVLISLINALGGLGPRIVAL